MGSPLFPFLPSALLLLSGEICVGQYPVLPERPPRRAGQQGRTPRGTGLQGRPLRFPGRGAGPSTGTGSLPPQAGPRGTAPRLGTGMGLWEALIAMSREEGGGKTLDLGSVPDRSLLLRYSDLVGVRREGERGWEIVPWWKKVRLLEPGCQVDLSHRGRALQILYDGAILDVRAPSRWDVLRLDRGIAVFRFQTLRALFTEAADRLLRLELPGGYVVDLQSCQATIRFEGGRFRVANLGPKPLVVHDRKREIHLAWNEGCLLPVFTGPVPPPLPPLGPAGSRIRSLGKGTLGLSWSESLEAVRGERAWVFGASQAPGKVRWGGCAFDLPKGGSLKIQPFRRLPFKVIREEVGIGTGSASGGGGRGRP